MALNNFIPTVWSARILQNLQKALVFGSDAVINTDFEGEIRQMGDTVVINSIGAVTVSNYTKNTNLSDPETLNDGAMNLLINQAKSFNFQVDDIDKAQAKPKVIDEAMREAGYALADALDQYIAGLYTDVATANLIGTTGSPKTDLATAGKPYQYLVELATKLDENNVPRMGRFVIIPPWYNAYLIQDTKFLAATPQGDNRLEQGLVGKAAGFDVFMSNNVINTSSTKYRIVAGYKGAWSMAMQLNQVEAYRPEKRFADAVKGLQLYGAKVTRPTGLACLTANPT